MTAQIADTVKETIDPAIAKATAEKKFDDLTSWSTIAVGLERDFVRNFLLMRVCGLNLIATGKDAQYAALADQIGVVKKGDLEVGPVGQGKCPARKGRPGLL